MKRKMTKVNGSRPRLWVIAGVTALALALPGSAFGAVRIGSNLDATALDPGTLFTSLTLSHRDLASADQAADGLTSPINGVVVRWRVRAATQSRPIAFRVIRPGADAEEAAGAGTSATKDPLSGTTTSFGLNPGMPIRVGDGIGINVSAGPLGYFAQPPGAQTNAWDPPLVDAGPPRAPGVGPGELLLQAVIEPDKDRDLLGDESQDPDGGNPPAPAPRPCNIKIFDLCLL